MIWLTYMFYFFLFWDLISLSVVPADLLFRRLFVPPSLLQLWLRFVCVQFLFCSKTTSVKFSVPTTNSGVCLYLYLQLVTGLSPSHLFALHSLKYLDFCQPMYVDYKSDIKQCSMTLAVLPLQFVKGSGKEWDTAWTIKKICTIGTT